MSLYFPCFTSNRSKELLCLRPIVGKEREDGLVSTSILLFHAGIRQVRPRRHPAVNLVFEDLDVLGSRQGGLELLNIFSRLVLRCQHNKRNFDPVVADGCQQGQERDSRVRWAQALTYFSASLASTMAGWHSAAILKGFSGVLATKEMTLEPQQNYRTEPIEKCQSAYFYRRIQFIALSESKERQRTYTNNAPFLDVGVLSLSVLQNPSNLGREARRAVLAEESADLLLLVLVVRGEELDGQGFAVEGVGHEDGVLLVVVGSGQNVAALDGLVEEAENVHNDQNALAGLLGRPRHVRLLAVNGLVVALLLVARGHDGGDVAAGGGVAAGGWHGRHFGGRGGAEALDEWRGSGFSCDFREW